LGKESQVSIDATLIVKAFSGLWIKELKANPAIGWAGLNNLYKAG